MPAPLILYSTNSWLAYAINERYYAGRHFVWCSPFRGPGTMPAHDVTTPPSSSPLEIYRALYRDVAAGDRHSSKIRDNKIGLLRGAEIRRSKGHIREDDERDIAAVIDGAETRDFRPLLYVIPCSRLSKKIISVPVEKRAHPLSDEFIIDDLRRKSFDVIEFPV